MKILYDGEIYNFQAAGGINRYFGSIISRLPEDFSPTITTLQSPTLHWPKHRNLKAIRYKRFKPRRISSKLEMPYFNFMLGRSDYGVFHPTYYNSLINREWKSYNCPIVLTVYDMIHEIFWETLDKSGYYRELKRQAVADAQEVICISEHTKSDLIKYLGVPESKITVTYLAADIDDKMSHGSESIPDFPYFLYVGTRHHYKNFDGLLQALSKIVKSDNAFVLCIVGPPLTPVETQTFADLGLSDSIRYYGNISDAHLAKLYRCSLAFVYPSLYEGFGIPPLEAMQCGTVVVASNASSVPEVVGDAAISFDPRKSGDLADILSAIAKGEINRQNLIDGGYRRAKQFSWQRTTDETVAVYRRLAK